MADSYQILHNDKDHQLRFVGGPSSVEQIQHGGRPPLKNQKTVMSLQLFDQSARNMEQWRILAIQIGLALKIENF